MRDDVDERLRQEAVRVYRRYAIEAVEALGFCPYAERARLEGRTREMVIVDAEPSDRRALEVVEALAEDERVEIGLVIFPRLDRGREALGRWVEALRKAHAARHGRRPVMAIEGFHPHAGADTTAAERLTPFVRRTPDPTLQLTRLSVLDRVRRGTSTGTQFFDPTKMDVDALLAAPPKAALHERIADRNLEAVVELGVSEVERIYRDILRDRDEAYRAIEPEIIQRAGG